MHRTGHAAAASSTASLPSAHWSTARAQPCRVSMKNVLGASSAHCRHPTHCDSSTNTASCRPFALSGSSRAGPLQRDSGAPPASKPGLAALRATSDATPEVAALKQEVAQLRTSNELLRKSHETVVKENQQLQAKLERLELVEPSRWNEERLAAAERGALVPFITPQSVQGGRLWTPQRFASTLIVFVPALLEALGLIGDGEDPAAASSAGFLRATFLRQYGHETRADAEHFCFGLRKVEGTWDD